MRLLALTMLAALAAVAIVPSASALALAPSADAVCGPELRDRIACLKEAISGGIHTQECEPCPWEGYHCYYTVGGVYVLEDPLGPQCDPCPPPGCGIDANVARLADE